MKLLKVTVLFLLLFLWKNGDAQEFQMPSDVKMGHLDNGLTYYIIPKGEPGKVKVSFISKIGAYAEKPDQHGYAHMVEHLLFKGSENYPGDACMEEMRLMGMRRGIDYNGYTSKLDTEYFMTIPENDKDYFKRSMHILKDWMFHLKIDGPTLEIEKKVIIEEIARAGGDPEGSPNLIGTQLEGHDVLGTMASVRSASSQDLYKFYKDNYIPENLAIIIYGKMDEQFVTKTIKKLFADVPAVDSRKSNQYIDVNEETIISGKYIRKRETDPAQLAILFKAKPVVKDDYISFKEYYTDLFYAQLLERRLSQNFDKTVTRLSVNMGSLIRGNEIYNFRLTLDEKVTYQQVFDSFCLSLAQVQQHGFTEKEIQFQKQLKLYNLNNRHHAESSMLGKVQDHFKKGDIPLSKNQFNQYARQVLKEITSNDLMDRFKRMVPLNATILYDSTAMAYSPAFSKTNILDKLNNLDAIVTYPFQIELKKANVPQQAEPAEVKIGDRPLANIQKQVQLDDGLTVLNYGNGVKVVLYQSMSEGATIKLLTGKGLNQLPKQHRVYYEKSLAYLNNTYGSYTDKEARSLERSISVLKKASVGNKHYELKLSGKSEYFDQMMKIFNLIISDVKYPESQEVIDRLKASVKRMSPKDISELNNDDINEDLIANCFQYDRMMKDDLHKAIVYIEGNLPGNIKELVSRYIGSLPSTKLKPVKQEVSASSLPQSIIHKDSTWTRDIAKISYIFKNASDRSLTMRDELILQGILEHAHLKMLNVLRQKYGLVYATGKSMAVSNDPYRERMLNIRFLTDTANVERAWQIMKDEVIVSIDHAILSDIEVKQIKAMVRSLYVMSFYDDKRLPDEWLTWYFKYGKLYSPKELDKMIKAISKQDLQKCLNEIIDVDCYQRETIRP